MAKDWGFIGGSAVHESVAIDSQRSVNLYPEVGGSGASKGQRSLMGIPGLASFCTLPTASVRGLFAQDGRAFAVSGTVLYELFSGGTVLLRGGGLIDDGLPATISSNGVPGHQLYVTSGRRGGVYDLTANTWTPDIRTDATCGVFVDGYFLSLDATTSTVSQSNLMNGTTWGGTAVLQRSLGSDTLAWMAAINRMVVLLGSKTTEVWYNAGTTPFAFAPFQGGFLEHGIVAPASVAWCDNSLIWLGLDRQGPATFWKSVGFQAQAIGSHALAQAISGYSTISDAVAFSYTDRDHAFYVVSFPTAGKTWSWDASSGQWHERAFWNTSTGLWEIYKPRYHCYAFGKHLVGNGASGAVYELSRTTYTDAGGVPLRRMRQGPFITNEQRWYYHRRMWLDLETGVGTSTVTDPQVMHAWSEDGARSWVQESQKSFGAQGAYRTRVEWRRLGRSRQRAYRAVVSDAVPVRIADAYLEIDEGGGG